MNSPPVTIVIPVKNEEKNIAKCLSQLRAFSEVIVIDSHSTDQTPKIVKQFDRELINFEWNGKYPKKRNWVLQNVKISNPWVLFLDADEYISEEFTEELRKKITSSSKNAYWLTYHNYFFGSYLKHGDAFKKLALFKVAYGEYERIREDSWSHFDMEIHEHPIIKGEIGEFSTSIKHEDYKGMKAYITKHNEYSDWEAHRYFSIQETWSQLTIRQKVKYYLLNTWFLAPAYFVYSYILKFGFMDGKSGFIFALLKMQYFWQIKIKIDEFKK
ncbi:glycosyltransferase family 2 protein [Lentisphaera marina]|uniref:glycosyltransferase family 2 protein n=1 Tax=Lentisphaera marina TaxID=1111041 RepID=UPI0023655F20|nr:glycosyltransferase family 2 protein [Lentisphaera marina]MDD7986906.1 glycosyltransferase family 2 protein [Lentisphaera marina]